ENVEAVVHYLARPRWVGTARLLFYANQARMGSYREAVNAYLAHIDPVPNIEAHRDKGRAKYGIGLSLEQQMGDFCAFLRIGWNDGRNESFAYTEIDDTLLIGADLSGALFRRPLDRAGLAFVTSGISEEHRLYLALGGKGFLLGDGALRYGRETIIETYYTV